jgi:hypothetical protein
MKDPQGPGKVIPIPVIKQGTPAKDAAASPEGVWASKRRELAQCALERDWEKVLKILAELSTSRLFPEKRKALAQRAWVALKSDAPGIEVVVALRELVMTLRPQHELAGPLGALAYLMAQRRQTDHRDHEFAVGMSQQLLHLICEGQGVGQEDDAFQKWVTDNRLEDPDYYLPKVMEGLKIMVLDDWWFDHARLQEDLLQANQARES